MNKNDHDGYVFIHPKVTYQDIFNESHKASYDSEYAYYRRSLFKKIEARFPDAERRTVKQFINGNRNLVDDEIIYISRSEYVLIAIKQHWNINDYVIDDEELNMLPGIEEPEEVDDKDMPVIMKIRKTDKFQAKVTMYTHQSTSEFDKFFSKIVSKDKKASQKERELNIICCSQQEGIYLQSFKTNKTDIILEDNYNDDFIEVASTILQRLSKKRDNGIVLFHSEPGCGKTSFLRYITQKITNKRLIYMPPDLTHKLADPDFMGFLMGYPDSILIIEDAENALQRRDAGGNQAVSNLLNNSDGLLGDALRLQIVCTFNCDIKNIDPALLRPGRLIAEYKFEKLSKSKTEALIKKLYGEDSEHLHRCQPQTLAEIYNLNRKKFLSNKGGSTIGFNSNR